MGIDHGFARLSNTKFLSQDAAISIIIVYKTAKRQTQTKAMETAGAGKVTVHGSLGLCRLVWLRAVYTAFPVPVSGISTSKRAEFF
ncbi:hypothetical protein C0033_09705 [Clostridium sp. chh4-2]|uniref:hypothetical protein n=1 Tax=Clostridium sp. chh4-2 TaxID=2067550 RepID=UPI000CCF2255|nr:hypothetical protein [Clostridium sp. chh4-2]PNV62372.1 hypothetical protein C0033_09705 [Clostridium sp. chh4-2]